MTRQTHSRRDFLTRAATAAAVGLSGTAQLSGVSVFATPLTQSLASTSTAGLIPYGSAVRAGALESDSTYREAIIANCHLVVAEGEMKWADIRSTRGEYRFEKADSIIDFARQNRLEVRGHTLAWYGGLPKWTDEISSRAEAERELVDHIKTVVSRYRGVIPSWDVVNEPLVDFPEDATSLRPCVWTKHLGADYLSIALRTAAAVDPQARLVLNEYDIEFKGAQFLAKRNALL